MPVVPGRSLRDPARYRVQTVTTGAACNSLVRTLRPLGRTASRIGEASVEALPTAGIAKTTQQAKPTANCQRRGITSPSPAKCADVRKASGASGSGQGNSLSQYAGIGNPLGARCQPR